MYPQFKMGEIWGQVWEQVRTDGGEFTKDDEHWVRTSLEEFEEQMNNCISTQMLIKKEFNQN